MKFWQTLRLIRTRLLNNARAKLELGFFLPPDVKTHARRRHKVGTNHFPDFIPNILSDFIPNIKILNINLNKLTIEIPT